MKVLLVNGSPHKSGCTCTALCEIADTLREEGIEAAHYWIGNKPIGGCVGCFQCAKKQRCLRTVSPTLRRKTRISASAGIRVFRILGRFRPKIPSLPLFYRSCCGSFSLWRYSTGVVP